MFIAPVVIPESHYQKLLLACYNLTVKLLLLLLRSSGISTESKIHKHSSLDFYFSLSLLPFIFRFSCLIFFSLAGRLVGFILVGKSFWENL